MHRGSVATALFAYVLPLLTVSGLLALAGLGGLALALLGVEAVVATATVLARRRPARPAGPSRHPWYVPMVMAGVVAAVVGVAVLASHSG